MTALDQIRRTEFAEPGRAFELTFYAVCFAFIFLHVFILPATPIYYEADHINLLNDAKRITEGQFIYRDFFEFLFPGAHVLFAGLMFVFGAKYWLVSAVIIVHGMIAVWLGAQISRRVIGSGYIAYLPSAIFLFLGFRWFGVDGEHRMISPLFTYAAILVLLRSRSVPRLILAAVFCAGASFITQQRGFLTVAAVVIVLLIEFGLYRREWPRFLKLGTILGAVFTASLGIMLLPFIIVAGWEVFFEDTILFLAAYAQDPATNSLQTYLSTLTKISSFGNIMTLVTLFYSFLIPLVYAAALIVIFVRRNRERITEQAGILLVCLVGLLLSVGTSGPNVYRLYQVSIPALVALVWLFCRIKVVRPRIDLAAITALAAFGLVLGIRLQTAWDVKFFDTASGRLAFTSPVIAERYEWLLENSKPGDKVYEVYNSHVNFPLGLSNPSRMSILLNTGYSPPQHVAWAVEDLKREKPRYIIWDGAWTSELELLPETERLKPLYMFLTGNYHKVRSFTPYDGREMEMWELGSGNEDRY